MNDGQMGGVIERWMNRRQEGRKAGRRKGGREGGRKEEQENWH